MLKPGQTGGGGGGCPFEYRTWISLYRQKPTNISIPHKGKKSATHQLCPTQTYSGITVIIVYIGISDSEVQWLSFLVLHLLPPLYGWNIAGTAANLSNQTKNSAMFFSLSANIRGGRVLSTNANDLRSFNRLWRSTAKRSATVDDLKNWCPVSQ